MRNLYPITIYLAPVEYEALHNFCAYYASLVVSQPVSHVSNDHLLLADFYRCTFTYARNQSFTALGRRRSGKRYALKVGLIYARILLRQLHEKYAVSGLLVHVNSELSRGLVYTGDGRGIKRLS